MSIKTNQRRCRGSYERASGAEAFAALCEVCTRVIPVTRRWRVKIGGGVKITSIEHRFIAHRTVAKWPGHNIARLGKWTARA